MAYTLYTDQKGKATANKEYPTLKRAGEALMRAIRTPGMQEASVKYPDGDGCYWRMETGWEDLATGEKINPPVFPDC